MSEELKPCPFCGGQASLNYERIPGENKGFWAQVICNDCCGRSGCTWAGSYSAAERIAAKVCVELADAIKIMKGGGVGND